VQPDMPKRKTAASEEGAEDATGGAERQRLRPDSGRAQAQPGSGALGGSERSAPINVSRAAVLIAWVAAVAQRQGYSRDAGAQQRHWLSRRMLSGHANARHEHPAALCAGLSFGKAVAAMLALKERSGAACGGKEAATRRQREALLNVRMADVFGMQVSMLCSECLQSSHVPQCKQGFMLRKAVLLCHLACQCLDAAVQVKAVDYGKNDVRAVEDCQAVSATKVDEYLWRAFDGRMEEAEAAFGVRPCAAVSLVPCSSIWDV